MGFFKALFGGADTTPEEESAEKERRWADDLKYDGARALKTGRFDIALSLLTEALNVRPDDDEARDYLAQTYLRRGELAESLKEYVKLTESRPDNVALLQQAAHVAYMQEDYDKMESLLLKAKEQEASSAMTDYMMAQLRLGQQRPVEAIAFLTQAIATDENMGDARLLRGKTLLSLGDVDGASTDAAYLLEQVPDQEDVLLLSANIEAQKGNTDAALELFERVLDVNPFCIEVFKQRGKLYLQKGMTKEAEADMKQLLELNPEIADVSGEFSAEGIENKVKQAYSAINPFGL